MDGKSSKVDREVIDKETICTGASKTVRAWKPNTGGKVKLRLRHSSYTSKNWSVYFMTASSSKTETCFLHLRNLATKTKGWFTDFFQDSIVKIKRTHSCFFYSDSILGATVAWGSTTLCRLPRCSLRSTASAPLVRPKNWWALGFWP